MLLVFYWERYLMDLNVSKTNKQNYLLKNQKRIVEITEA